MTVHPDRLVQLNVRVHPDQRDAIEARRLTILDPNTGKPISRDEWVRRAFTWALRQAPGTPAISTPQGRTPHRQTPR